MNRTRIGWAAAVLVYLLAVLHRASLSVAGLTAEQRFGISPSELSVFIFLQLGVYAAMQVPTGVLVDRYGPRRVLLAASTVMAAAQLLFASVPSYPAALFARALLGGGDALTFISVLRYTAVHFAPRRYPLLVALTGMAGMVGNVAATLPFALALRHVGWGVAFASAAGLSALAAVGVLVFIDDAVNVGGFLAAVLIALGIGWALDAQGGTSPHALRWAVLVAVGVQLLGAVRMAVWLRRLRAFTLERQEQGEQVPVPVVRRRWDLPL